jgi:hypothetical protein
VKRSHRRFVYHSFHTKQLSRTTFQAHLVSYRSHPIAERNKMTEPKTEALDSTAPTPLDTDIEHDSAAIRTPDEEKSNDCNVVNFEGPNDPANPINWSTRKKFLNITIVSLMTLLSYEVLPLERAQQTNFTFFAGQLPLPSALPYLRTL